jgi:uncharacterized damage-inducible protein DinB
MNTPFAELFRYNKWANERTLVACRDLPDDVLDAPASGTYGSIRETLRHMLGGQEDFVSRTHGRQHEGQLRPGTKWPGFDVVYAIATQTSDELIAIAGALDEDRDVALPFQGKNYTFPLSFFLVHAITHGVEHRTQIGLMLAQQGITPPDLDGWPYATAAGFGRES